MWEGRRGSEEEEKEISIGVYSESMKGPIDNAADQEEDKRTDKEWGNIARKLLWMLRYDMDDWMARRGWMES